MTSQKPESANPEKTPQLTIEGARKRKIVEVFDSSLDLPSDDRRSFIVQQFPDDEAAVTEVFDMLAADEQAPSIMPTEIAGSAGETVLVAPQRIGPYRLENIVGAGGMGEVWRGVRDDGLFDQVVAIKLMRPSRYPSESLAFFDTERRALARLSHRHIARLFDGGVTEAGLPWFVMELVDGLPLHLYAASQKPDLKACLLLMAKISEAVQYAHQQLVVHADLKPSNILITPQGEPVLVDFGIASLAATAADQTEKAAFPSTPAYASPQRLAGLQPTPSDDIFSLGLMLSGLVSGNWPQGPIGEALPQTGNHGVQPLVQKACAQDPNSRYATAAELASDLRALLEKRPTSLQVNSLKIQAWLMARRHPRVTGATIGGLLSALVALIVISFLYVQADQQRHRAEARFNDVRALAGYMIGDFHDELLKLPGSTALRERNASVGWEYLTHLSKDDDVSDDVRSDIAVGFGRLGNAQATTSTNSTGKVKDGDWALQTSETLLRGLLKTYPDRDDYRRELARTLVWRSGVILGSHHDAKGAQRAMDEAFQLYDQVLKRNPKDLEAAYWRWNATLGVADYLYAQGQWAELKSLMETTQARFLDLPVTPKYQSMRTILVSSTENYIGDASYYLTGPEAGISHYKNAQRLLSQARAQGLNDMRLVQREGYYDYQLASSYEDTKRPHLTIIWADKGRALLESLSLFDHSAPTEHILDILNMQRALGLSELGRETKAVAQIEETLRRRQTLLRQYPDDLDNRLNLARALTNANGFYLKAKSPKKACRAAHQALILFAYLERHGGVAEIFRQENVIPLTKFVATCPVQHG